MKEARTFLYLSLSFLLVLTACDDSTTKGDKLFEQGNYREAINQYSLYIVDHPKDGKSFYNRGRAYEELNMTDSALQDFRSAYKIDDRNANFLMSLGIINFKLENFDRTVSHMGALIKLNNNNPQAYLLRGRAHFKLGKFGKALDNFNAAIAQNDKYGEAYLYRGVVLAGPSNKKSQGCADIKKAVSLKAPGAKQVQQKYCR